MSDNPDTPNAARRRLAEELAAAVREGVEARDWRFQPPPRAFPPPELDPLVHAPAVSDLANVPVPSFPGVKGRLVRAVRRVLRGLLKPWTDQQTSYNRLTAHLLHHQGVHLADRMDRAAAQLQERVDELTRLYFEAARRLDELDGRRPAAAVDR